MQHLEVSSVVQPLYGSLRVKGLNMQGVTLSGMSSCWWMQVVVTDRTVMNKKKQTFMELFSTILKLFWLFCFTLWIKSYRRFRSCGMACCGVCSLRPSVLKDPVTALNPRTLESSRTLLWEPQISHDILFKQHTNKCTYIVFNSLKFTLKHLKCS